MSLKDTHFFSDRKDKNKKPHKEILEFICFGKHHHTGILLTNHHSN